MLVSQPDDTLFLLIFAGKMLQTVWYFPLKTGYVHDLNFVSAAAPTPYFFPVTSAFCSLRIVSIDPLGHRGSPPTLTVPIYSSFNKPLLVFPSSHRFIKRSAH